ncbi:MAG: GNAT family N-acetyltransferase [Pseudoxanthomonas sp.]
MRGTIPEDAPADAVLDDIRVLAPDVAIFRCPSGSTVQSAALLGSGLVPLHADTLVYYQGALEQSGPVAPMKRSEEILRAVASDGEGIAAVAHLAFSGYRSHYHANPRFGHDRILAGYVDWAIAYARPGQAGMDAWVVKRAGDAIGFATCRADAKRAEVEILLNAVHPDYSGQGIYTRLVAAMMNEYRHAGIRTIRVSTQAWNCRVQRAWIRLGLLPHHALDTYHLNLPARGAQA